jgi:hypothetical protein
MKVKALLTVVVVVFAMALMLGCAKVPQAELDAAKAALDAAKVPRLTVMPFPNSMPQRIL